MPTTSEGPVDRPRLSLATALRVEEERCEVGTASGARTIAFARPFPAPRIERVSPGHLVAVASDGGAEAIVWRWFDAVVLGRQGESIRIWEPGHGEVLAAPRDSAMTYQPGSRAYASAGLPGADWWVAGRVSDSPSAADVELDAVEQMFSDNGLWDAVFGL